MKYAFIILIFLCVSCGNEKTISLPEIEHAEITKIRDVSPAYIFYDEKQADSVELNRKNLIITTNWLVNVDKRLLLKQAIPQIMYLQDKKRNAKMHKNENAKNYYSCNDTSIHNLGFMEFTNVVYNINKVEDDLTKILDLKISENAVSIAFSLDQKVTILNPNSQDFITNTTPIELFNYLKEIDSQGRIIYLSFDKNLSFQHYITYKSSIQKFNFKYATIANQEFIFN